MSEHQKKHAKHVARFVIGSIVGILSPWALLGGMGWLADLAELLHIGHHWNTKRSEDP